ncbi:MAG: hypothetical protein KAR55_05185, partial [Thermoplasmatales archaeon]|nr:hypothetical protein [Thermoplasmatales archaeon]
RPNIDITTVTYELSGDTVTLSMTVKGNIVTSDYILYSIWWTDGDLLTGYVAQYRNGNGYVMKDVTILDSEFSISPGNTITFTFTRLDITEFTGVVGSAKESAEDYSNTWIDNAPDDLNLGGDDEPGDDEEPGDDDPNDDDDEIPPNGDDTGGNGNGENGGGTPGFEAIAVITALAIALILLRRKK